MSLAMDEAMDDWLPEWSAWRNQDRSHLAPVDAYYAGWRESRMTPMQAQTILEYLQRQESTLRHDNEAYRLHSGASFILRSLGITREQLEQEASQPIQSELFASVAPIPETKIAAGWSCCGKPVEIVGLDVKCSICKRVSR